MKNPNTKAGGSAAFYGMAATIADRSLVDRFARGYCDAFYIPYLKGHGHDSHGHGHHARHPSASGGNSLSNSADILQSTQSRGSVPSTPAEERKESK